MSSFIFFIASPPLPDTRASISLDDVIQELASVDRLFFQLEQAWWWYEDFLADNDDSLPHFSQENFTRKFFQHCPLLRPLHGQFDALQKKFMLWKGKIPVVGCILLNVSRKKVLLVKNWKGNGRTFPRGKINQGESDRDAAVREVQEETGFDPAPLMEYSQVRCCCQIYLNMCVTKLQQQLSLARRLCLLLSVPVTITSPPVFLFCHHSSLSHPEI